MLKIGTAWDNIHVKLFVSFLLCQFFFCGMCQRNNAICLQQELFLLLFIMPVNLSEEKTPLIPLAAIHFFIGPESPHIKKKFYSRFPLQCQSHFSRYITTAVNHLKFISLMQLPGFAPHLPAIIDLRQNWGILSEDKRHPVNPG